MGHRLVSVIRATENASRELQSRGAFSHLLNMQLDACFAMTREDDRYTEAISVPPVEFHEQGNMRLYLSDFDLESGGLLYKYFYILKGSFYKLKKHSKKNT